ncbi:MAG: DUF6768 family protein [Sphingomonas bacterium]
MRDVDTLIDEALDAEERDLLRSIGEEQGFITQVFGVFRGRMGWVSMVMMGAQGVIFVAGAWAAWRFFEAGDTLTALHWGFPAAVLLMTSTMIKTALFPTIHGNRLMRELKRIELQIARHHGA